MTGTYKEGQCEFLDELIRIGKFVTMNEFAKKKESIKKRLISKFEEELEYDQSEFIIFFSFYNMSAQGYAIVFEEYYWPMICYRTDNWYIQVRKNNDKKSIIALYSRKNLFCYLIFSHYDLSSFFERNEGLITKEDFLPEEKFLLDLI